MSVRKDLGMVTAYAYAVSKGYAGTEEEFATLMASYADVGQAAVDAALAAKASEDAAKASETAAEASKTAAATSAGTASTAAQNATQAAQTATTKASEATTAATTATTKAAEAAQSATQAAASATAAGTSATAAQTAQTAAETAQTAAETAQGAAEDAAESVEGKAAQIDQNTEDISLLKSHLGEETGNNYLGFVKQTKTVNGVTVECDGAGRFVLTGTASSNGGRTTKLTNLATIQPGSYVFYVEIIGTLRPNSIVYIEDSANNIIKDIGLSTASRQKEVVITSETQIYVGISVSTSDGSYNNTISVSFALTGNAPPFFPPYTAKDLIARYRLDGLDSEIGTSLVSNTTLLQATISGTGAETSNDKRVVTQDMFAAKGLVAEVGEQHYIWIAEYDALKTFIRVTTTTQHNISNADLSADTAFVRIIVVNTNINTAITPSEASDLVIKYVSLVDTANHALTDISAIRRIHSRMEFGAHNGAEYLAPECSIAAYKIAGQQGYEWAWIAGIWFSADETMYVNHDASLDRTTDGTGNISDLTDTYINAHSLDITTPAYKLSDFPASDLVIPTFEQILQICLRYGMKMCIRLNDFPEDMDTADNAARWNAFKSLLTAYNVKNDYVTYYLGSRARADIVRSLFGDDAEISVYLGASATAQDAVDWFETQGITGNRAFIISIDHVDLAAVKLLHTNGIRVYAYGGNSVTYDDICDLATWGVDIYQNSRWYKFMT